MPRTSPVEGETGGTFHFERDSEIGDVRLVLFVEQDIAWFEIAMKHAALMRMLDRFGDFLHERGGFSQRDGPLAHRPAEIRTGDVIHRVIQRAGTRADIVNGNDAADAPVARRRALRAGNVRGHVHPRRTERRQSSGRRGDRD